MKKKFVRLALLATTGVFILGGGCGFGGGLGGLVPIGITAFVIGQLFGTGTAM